MPYNYDYLVIGGGAAGLLFAIEAAKNGRVAVVSKKDARESNSFYAQGGVAAVTSSEDSFAKHIEDTIAAGAGLCDPKIVRLAVTEGPERIKQLQSLGVKFTKRAADPNELDLGKEGGHSKRRIVHAKDATGKAIVEALLDAARAERNVEIFENHMAVDLIMRGKLQGRRGPSDCLGAYVLDEIKREVLAFVAPVTVLATGGAGKVYLYTSNPDVATGDGVAIAYRAGARAANMEFFQFHPTCLYHPKAKSFLISEALRGEGGELVRADGEPFMKKYHKMGSLAPRDVVARAIDAEMKREGCDCVYLDMSKRTPEFIRDRFPTIYASCLKFGIDVSNEPIPVVPAAHYMCGGVLTDEWGKTNIEGLFAVGETACTGLHGANRLASNSLLEAIVFAHRAAKASSKTVERFKSNPPPSIPEWNLGMATDSDEMVVISQTWDEVRRFMWNYVGIVRTDKRLLRALRRILYVREEIEAYYWNFYITRDLLELRNLALVSELIIKSALYRKESRGLHNNADYPQTDDVLFNKNTVL